MKRIVRTAALPLALACAALSLTAAPAPLLAQPADAFGKPLPDGNLPLGTIMVRIVGGTPPAALADFEVVLSVDGTDRTAKTDEGGRATFSGLPAGAKVRATIANEKQESKSSEWFSVPASGGARVMLSTQFGAENEPPPEARNRPAAGGPPEPRSMSGQPRPDETVPPGNYLVRLTYNSLSVQSGAAHDPAPPVGEIVTLVGYRQDNSVDVRSLPIDAKGYANFEQLDVSGDTVYFALARLPRAGATDRLMAQPVQPATQAGAKLILSGDKRTATTPPVDDTVVKESLATPAGKVRITLDAVPAAACTVRLFDAATHKVIAEAQAPAGKQDAASRPEVVFDVAYQPNLVLYAETRTTMIGAKRDELYRSRPFQLVESAGVHMAIDVYPRVLIQFKMTGGVEDEMLAVQGTYTIQNGSWIPFKAGPDGLIIALPKGFKSPQVAQQSQSIASPAPGEGIRVLRPLSPGITQFLIGYTLVSEGGKLDWRLDLPFGTFQSGLQIRLHEGMQITPHGASGRIATANDNAKWFVLDNITIQERQSMQMEIIGMPAAPEWRSWLPKLIGVLVVVLIAGGVVIALIFVPPRRATPDQRRAALFDELVELEQTGADPARRDQIYAELERILAEIAPRARKSG